MKKLRVLLVDDSREFINSAASLLSLRPELDVVGQARSGAEAIRLATELEPDLVLMDIAMPQMNGLEATRRIKAKPSPPRVVVLTLHNNAEYRSAARAVGSDGFLSKEDFPVKLIPLIHTLFKEAS